MAKPQVGGGADGPGICVRGPRRPAVGRVSALRRPLRRARRSSLTHLDVDLDPLGLRGGGFESSERSGSPTLLSETPSGHCSIRGRRGLSFTRGSGVRPRGARRCDEEAEGVPCGIRVHVQRFVRVVRAVAQQASAEGKRSLVLRSELFLGGNAQIEVELLGDAAFGPGRGDQTVDVLEGESRSPCGIDQHEPVASLGIWLACRRALVAGPVVEPEEAAVELRQAAGVARVEDH